MSGIMLVSLMGIGMLPAGATDTLKLRVTSTPSAIAANL